MALGIDTTFLIQLELKEVTGHSAAIRYLEREILARAQPLALAPQVLTEFIHIVTDKNRFQKPLGTGEAIEKAHFWWGAQEVRRILPSSETPILFLEWMKKFDLGRKRLLDTFLAATYYLADVDSIVSSNARDFSVFGCFKIINPAAD